MDGPTAPISRCAISNRTYGQLPDEEGFQEAHELRRRVIHALSKSKLDYGRGYQAQISKQFKVANGHAVPAQLHDLCKNGANSYIALIKGDVDGLGRLLSQLKYELLGQELGTTPEQAALCFANELRACIEGAVDESIWAAYVTDCAKVSHGQYVFPFLPLLTAGDDLWILARYDLAFGLVRDIAATFEKKIFGAKAINAALRASQIRERLSLSFGVLFAKQGFPFDAQLNFAEELERNSKSRRKKSGRQCGHVDYHWLSSSGRESVAASRENSLALRDGSEEFRLYSRPWAVCDLAKFIKASKEFDLPGRKLKQLEQILRLGKNLSAVAFQCWYASLTETERMAVETSTQSIDQRYRSENWIASNNRLPIGPWHKNGTVFETVLLELAEMREILT